MSRLILSEALSKLAPEARDASDANATADINAVLEQLISGGKWAGTTERWKGTDTASSFAIQQDDDGNRFITLPRTLLTVLGTGYSMSNQPIRSKWHEFAVNGFPADKTVNSSGLHDWGDGYTTFGDFTGPCYLRVKTSVAEESGTSVLFRGTDENDKKIFTIPSTDATVGGTPSPDISGTFTRCGAINSKPLYLSSQIDEGGGTMTTFALWYSGDSTTGWIISRATDIGNVSTITEGWQFPSSEDPTGIYSATLGAALTGVPTVSVDGTDPIEGVELDISTNLTTTTTQQFSGPRPTMIVKPITRGPIDLYAVDVSTGDETLIGTYDPGETVPNYRRYRLGAVSAGATLTTIHCMTKRRFVEAVADSDELIPGSLRALELGLIARRFDLTHDVKEATEYWRRAFALLNSQLAEEQGNAQTRVQIQSDGTGFNVGRVSGGASNVGGAGGCGCCHWTQ